MTEIHAFAALRVASCVVPVRCAVGVWRIGYMFRRCASVAVRAVSYVIPRGQQRPSSYLDHTILDSERGKL